MSKSSGQQRLPVNTMFAGRMPLWHTPLFPARFMDSHVTVRAQELRSPALAALASDLAEPLAARNPRAASGRLGTPFAPGGLRGEWTQSRLSESAARHCAYILEGVLL